MGSGPGTGLTEAGPKVYRIALHPVVSPETLIQKAPSERRTNPPPLNPLPANRLSVPAEMPKREEREKLTTDLKKPEEPVLQSEIPKKEEASVTLPPALLARSPEESEEERKHQPVVAAAPIPSLEVIPDMKETVNARIPGGVVNGGNAIAAVGPGEGPVINNSAASGLDSVSGPRPGPGSALVAELGSARSEGNGNGSGGHGDNGSLNGGGSGNGRPAWSGNGRQVVAGTGIPGSGNGSGKGEGNGKRGDGSIAFGSGGGGTAIPSPRHAENPRPVYPPEAKKNGYHGQVLLKVEILSSGLVGEIEIKRSSGHRVLDQSALRAVKQWKFSPARQEGIPVAFWVNIPFTFEFMIE